MYFCEYCNRQFSYKNSVSRHIRRSHTNKKSRHKITCSECFYQCRFYSNLRSHIYSEHKITPKLQQMFFSSMEDFFTWKKEYEKTMYYSYVKHSSTKVSSISGERKTYYVCHRSGPFFSGSGGKRKLKRQGSNKIDASCPSTMEVVESIHRDAVRVVLWKTHMGHNAEVTRLFLSQDERNWLAMKIAEGASFSKIVDEVHKLGEEFSRLCLLKSQDVRNIRKTILRHRFNRLYSGITSWVRTIDELCGISPVLLFKEQNQLDPKNVLRDNDIMLVIMTEFQKDILKKSGSKKICFDATYSFKDYDFLLITLFATDENGSWCPVCYCISTRFDTPSLEYFLTVIKNYTGRIRCNIFLSDDMPNLYEAWCKVMSIPDYKFLHSWVVDQDWRSNLVKINGSDNLKEIVYNTLTSLLTESRAIHFEKKMLKFSEDLIFNKNTVDFGLYFKEVYVSRPIMWAYCYRMDLGLESEIHLESMHKSLNHHYYEGVKKSMLEECINMLIKLARDCDAISKRILTVCENNMEARIEYIKKSHHLALFINYSDIKEIVTNSYEIKSSSQQNQTHIVQDLNINCACFLICDCCNICAHSYSCTCADHTINYNICKHIHACAMYKNNSPVEMEENSSLLDSYIEEVVVEDEPLVDTEDWDKNIICEEVEFESIFLPMDQFVEISYSNDETNSENRNQLLDNDSNSIDTDWFLNIGKHVDENIQEDKFEQCHSQPVKQQLVTESVVIENDDLKYISPVSYNMNFSDESVLGLEFCKNEDNNYLYRKLDNNLVVKHKVNKLFTFEDFKDKVHESIQLGRSFDCAILEKYYNKDDSYLTDEFQSDIP